MNFKTESRRINEDAKEVDRKNYAFVKNSRRVATGFLASISSVSADPWIRTLETLS